MKFPIIRTATLYKVTETYEVTALQRDYTRIVKNDNKVRTSKWKATFVYYYWRDSKTNQPIFHQQLPLPGSAWNTPRNTDASGLQGYIYPP